MKTNQIIFIPLLVLAVWLGGRDVRAELNVVTSTPDLALLAEEVGGGLVTVKSLARGSEDPHFVDPKPSFVPLIRRADLLLRGGAALELGWLPEVANNAASGPLLYKGRNNIDCSTGITLIRENYSLADYAMADVHPKGNPHYLIDPVRAKQAARNIADAFAKADPDHAEVYRGNAKKFAAAVDAALPRWKAILAPFKGTKVVTWHTSHTYFLKRFGMEFFDAVEPMPGVTPPPGRFAQLAGRMKKAGVKVIVTENFRSRRLADRLAEASGASVARIPSIAHRWNGAGSYVEFIDRAVDELRVALK